jgi:pantetheine-phosphate adenylyltransferase
MKSAVKQDNRIALFPGSFDPFTNGHLDLARRASALFSEVIVAVAHNPAKTSLFTPEERVELIERSCAGLKNVRAMHFGGLVVDFAQKCGARVIIRGLRAVSDFEFEFQMALMNRHLAPKLEIVFLMPDQAYTYLNSSLVKEVARHGGEIRGLVPPVVEKSLRARFAREQVAAKPRGRKK